MKSSQYVVRIGDSRSDTPCCPTGGALLLDSVVHLYCTVKHPIEALVGMKVMARPADMVGWRRQVGRPCCFKRRSIQNPQAPSVWRARGQLSPRPAVPRHQVQHLGAA